MQKFALRTALNHSALFFVIRGNISFVLRSSSFSSSRFLYWFPKRARKAERIYPFVLFSVPILSIHDTGWNGTIVVTRTDYTNPLPAPLIEPIIYTYYTCLSYVPITGTDYAHQSILPNVRSHFCLPIATRRIKGEPKQNLPERGATPPSPRPERAAVY